MTLLYCEISFDAPTTLHHVLSVCARSFTEINHNATRNMIGVQYATPQPWQVLIAWSLNHVFHIPIIIPKQAPCQSIEPFARNPPIYSYWFSLIIPSIISSSFYTSSYPGFIFKTLKESPNIFGKNIPCPSDPSPLKIWSDFSFEIFLWIQ
jgi:hypothetical protein